jgi:hypothetical protein
LPLLILLTVLGWSYTEAGPVTGQTSVQTADAGAQASTAQEDSATATSFTTSGLFDAVGLPLLQASAPLYLHLSDRPKLRNIGQGGGGGGGADAGSAGASGILFDPGAAGIGNVGFEYGQGTADPLPFTPPSLIPEPALLLLMAPALAFAVRRARRHQTPD